MEKIATSTIQFLHDLKQNNDRDWFTQNKDRYDTARKNIKAVQVALLDRLNQHDEIEDHKLFRIYRDVRFSKDKTPYKVAFSGSFVRATKWRRGGYYFHIEPGNNIIAGGFWNPNAADLKRARAEIAAQPAEMRAIIQSDNFVKTFGQLEGAQVKTAPRGYSKEHPAIDLLRYKQYLLIARFSDADVLQEDFLEKTDNCYRQMRPFFDYMSEVLTTDQNGVPIED